MPYVENTTTGKQVWSYSERDSVIRYNSDQYRTGAEQFARRVEEYLYDTASPHYQDPVFLSWSVAMFDREKISSGGYESTFDPNRASVEQAQKKPTQQFSAADVEVHVPKDAYIAGFVKQNDSHTGRPRGERVEGDNA